MDGTNNLITDDARHTGRQRIRGVISLLLYVAGLVLLDVLFRWVFRANDSCPMSELPPLLASIFWCLMLAGISMLLPTLLRRIYMVLTTVIFIVFVLVHAGMESFFGQYMTFSSVIFANDGADYFEWSYISIPPLLIVFVILCLAISVFAAVLLPKKAVGYRCRLIIAAVLLIVSATGVVATTKLTFANEHGYIVWDTTKSHSDYYEEFSDYHYCMHMCGLYHYTFCDIYNSTGIGDSIELMLNSSAIDELDGYYSEKAIDEDNEMTGIFKGRDLILIQLESIDSWMVNETAMPTFTSLMSKGISFTNFYAPKFLTAATFGTENAVNTGLVTPLNSGKTSYFTKNAYPYSLPNLFSDAGYTVNSFHRSGAGMYNRGEIHRNWGYEKYYGAGDLGINGDMDSNMLEAYDSMVLDKPFMSFFISYTGHGPYTADTEAVKAYEEIIRAGVPKDSEDEYVWALCHAYETDVFIKGLVDRLEADGRMDNTVLIFYTDHYDHYITGEGILEKYKGTEDQNLMGNVPCLIYTSDLEPQKVDKAIATYDLTPTIVNLFGLDYDGRHYLGNDAFSENGGYVIFRDLSWYDGEIYFNMNEDKATELSKQRSREINERLNATWELVRYDYFNAK